jgi:uncharacterized protein
MKTFVAQRPFTFALLLLLALEVFVLAGLLASYLLDIPLLALDLPIMLANALFAVGLLTALGWWGATGFNRPAHWQNLHLLLFPILLLLIPAILFRLPFPTAGNLLPLLIITLLIGFQEEAIFRGILLNALKPRGVWTAVFVSAFLFGIIHANSFLVGRDPFFALAQIVASFLGAIGLAALRIRLNSIWPLILLHALNDFIQFSATGGLEAQQVAAYIPAAKITISSLMALYGIYLLRHLPRSEVPQSAAGEMVPL